MSVSGSLVSEIEEVVIIEEEEDQSVEYIIEEIEEEVIEAETQRSELRTGHTRQSVFSEYVEMSLDGSEDFMSMDDLNDVADSQREKHRTRGSYTSSEGGSSAHQQSPDDADVTTSSDDGFDLTLPETTNMENMHMSGLTLMDFTQSGMIDFQSSYMFELVDTDDEEEEELGNATETAPSGQNLSLSLNPYRVAMDKVRGGPIGKRRSTGTPKRLSTPRDLSPIRQQVTEYLESAVEAQTARKQGAPPNRVAPARTSSGMRRTKRRSLITSPIHEHKEHTPSTALRSGKRADILAQFPPPNFSKEDNDTSSKPPPTKTSKPNNDDDEAGKLPSKAPAKTIVTSSSNASHLSELTSSAHPRAATNAKMKDEIPSTTTSAETSIVLEELIPTVTNVETSSAANEVRVPMSLENPTTRAAHRNIALNDSRAPTKIIAESNSNTSDLSPLTASGHPRTVKKEASNKEEEVPKDQIPTRSITESNSNASEPSRLSASRRPKRQVQEREENTKSEVRRHNGIPKEAIARSKGSNSSELSPLTASGHPRGNIMMEDQSPSERRRDRIPAKSITASNSNSSELSPLTASGHPMRQISKAEENNPSRNSPSAFNSNRSELTPLSRWMDNDLDKTPPPSVAKGRRGRSRGGSTDDTDNRFLHGINLNDKNDDSSWSKAEGRVLEIQIPADLAHNPQDSFSTLDSESLAAESLMSSTRFESTPQQSMSKRSSDVSPVAPRRPARSPKIGEPKDDMEISDRSSSDRRRGGRKHIVGSEEGSRRPEGARRRSLDLASVSERHNESYNLDNSIMSLSTSMHNIGSSAMHRNSSSMHKPGSRRSYMRRDLSVQNMSGHSRRNLMKRQGSVSSFADHSRLPRQNSVSSFSLGGSRRNLMSHSSSKRSIMDESPSLPKRYLSIDVDMNVSNLELSMSSLMSNAEDSRQRRMAARDQSPMRPRRTLEKVLSPGSNIEEDDEESITERSFANDDPVTNEALPMGSLPASMRDVAPTKNVAPTRDLSPVRPRRTLSTDKVPTVMLFDDDDNDDDKDLISKDSSPKNVSLKDSDRQPSPAMTTLQEDTSPEAKIRESPSLALKAKNEKVGVKEPEMEPEKSKPAHPAWPRAEEEKEAEERMESELPIIVMDYIPPPPPLPKRGVPAKELRGRSNWKPVEEKAEIEITAQANARISPVPHRSTDKAVKNVKASPSPTEVTASSGEVTASSGDIEYEMPLDRHLSESRIENGKSPSSSAIVAQLSETSLSIAAEPKSKSSSGFHSSTDTEASFVSSSSHGVKRAQARATLEKLNSRMNSTFGEGVKAETTADLRAQVPAAVPTIEARRSSLEEKRQEAKAARERLRQRFANARARVQSQLM